MDKPQVLNKEIEKIAAVVALRSGEDDVFMVTPQGGLKPEKEMYGGWLLRPPVKLDVAYGVWCFTTKRGEAGSEVVERVREVIERVARIVNLLGVKSQPRISLVTKRFRVVKVVKVEAMEKYAVYDIVEPTEEEAVATLAYIHYYAWWSRRGRCHGEICSVLEKYSKLLKAEFKEDADDLGVYVPYDVSQLASVVAKLMSKATEEAGKGGAAASAPAQEADKTAIYLIVKLPRDAEEVIKELERVVKQRLKELNIEAEVQVRAEV